MYCGGLDDFGGKGHAENVVMKMIQAKLNCGHSLFMDHYHNSFTLASLLLRRDMYCTRTLTLDRKYLPQEVKTKNFKKGKTIVRYSESMCLGKWKDKRVIYFITTEYKNEMVTSLNRFQLERTKLLPIVTYNPFMKRVDHNDQMMSYYPCETKILRWYKKIFIHVLQMLMVNAHYVFNEVHLAVGIEKYHCRFSTTRPI